MLSVKFKNHLHLHLLVFIAGFTGVLGELISLEAIPLVWYRMLIALIMIFIFIKLRRIKLSISIAGFIKFFFVGVFIALHWITFFAAIKLSNISITLAMFSTGAFFTSLIEPIIHKRKIINYEILFGFIVVVAVFMIVHTKIEYIFGIILGILSAFFASLFSVMNGKFVELYNPSVISFYEFISGVFIISIFLSFSDNGFDVSFFNLSIADWIYLLILASVCTAYAFIGSIYVMRYITPYSVVLTYNLEPIYGFFLAVIFFPNTELMSPLFYFGTAIIIATILLNGFIKYKTGKINF
ncbi:MAG: EamA family transporter [Flavobacteriaceae bacterium]|nr:EamA family transporter [Flavobacteriaceae bacterium]|tara:strand:+ start:26065 stop:26955 length:891 start_codon:yes stop_codon:yes gene_type:complete